MMGFKIQMSNRRRGGPCADLKVAASALCAESGEKGVRDRSKISCTPSKIPYGGFSPVRLQAGCQQRPSWSVMTKRVSVNSRCRTFAGKAPGLMGSKQIRQIGRGKVVHLVMRQSWMVGRAVPCPPRRQCDDVSCANARRRATECPPCLPVPPKTDLLLHPHPSASSAGQVLFLFPLSWRSAERNLRENV